MRAFVMMSFECESREHAFDLSKTVGGPDNALCTLDVVETVTPAIVEDIGCVAGVAHRRALFPRVVDSMEMVRPWPSNVSDPDVTIAIDENAGIPTGTEGP